MTIDNQLLGSIIEASGMVIAAIITIVGLLITSKVVLSRKALKRNLFEALQDLKVLQKVEQIHYEMEISRTGTSNQRKVRDIVASETGYRTSGNNSPAQVDRKLERLSNIED
jgi:hypothetical protein